MLHLADRTADRGSIDQSPAPIHAPVPASSDHRVMVGGQLERGQRMAADGDSGFGIGQPVRRKEDLRLLNGSGRYIDDLTLPGLGHAVLVRSPHAHARIVSIDAEAALTASNVITILTGADYLADGLPPINHNPGLSRPPDVTPRVRNVAPIATPHYPMPADRVRFVGEPVALVVAKTIAAAKDAAERVAVAYDPLPAVAHA